MVLLDRKNGRNGGKETVNSSVGLMNGYQDVGKYGRPKSVNQGKGTRGTSQKALL
jgi:hypothetical protein